MHTRIQTARELASGRLFRAITTSIGVALWSQCLLVVTGILSARLLGVEDRGNLAILSLLAFALSLVCGLGLPLAVTYFLSKDVLVV